MAPTSSTILTGAALAFFCASGGVGATFVTGTSATGAPWEYEINVPRKDEERYNGQCGPDAIIASVSNGNPDGSGSDCSFPKWWRPSGQADYEYFHNGQFRMNYTDAKAFCEETMGARLAYPTDIIEAEHLIKLMDNNRHGFWLGMERYNGDAESMAINVGAPDYAFVQGVDATPIEWSNFPVGEPNSFRDGQGVWDEACAVQGTNWGNPILWNDVRCSKRRRVVCKRDYGLRKCEGKYDPRYCQSFERYFGYPGNGWTGPDLICPAGTSATNGNVGKCECVLSENEQVTVASLCPVMCSHVVSASNACSDTTTTSAALTTGTTVAPTTTTTEAPTTTTSFASTTTSFASTTSTVQTTTTTFETTSTTFVTTTTTGTTTTFQTTTTTAAPTTAALPDLGPCMLRPARGWYSINDDPEGLYGETDPIHCCYKFVSTPNLPWADAQAHCEALGDEYNQPGSTAGLATPYSPDINTFLTQQVQLKNRNYDVCNNTETRPVGSDTPGCRERNPQSTWLGGTTTNGSRVEWHNPFFAESEDYGNESAFHFAAEENETDNGMFYKGEPSGRDRSNGNKGDDEDCLSQGGLRSRVAEFGMRGWNDAKCSVKKAFFCEYCVREVTTTTAGPTTTTTATTTTTTSVTTITTTTTEATTTTTAEATTTTTAATTSTTDEATTSTTAEATTSTTAEPTTATTTTTAAPTCDTFKCSDDCGIVGDIADEEKCGWSKKEGKCIEGARTSKSELGRAEGGDISLCPDYIEQPALIALETMAYKCGSVKCSLDCKDFTLPGEPRYSGGSEGLACGWSRNKKRCLASETGAFSNTHELETPLGECPTAL